MACRCTTPASHNPKFQSHFGLHDEAFMGIHRVMTIFRWKEPYATLHYGPFEIFVSTFLRLIGPTGSPADTIPNSSMLLHKNGESKSLQCVSPKYDTYSYNAISLIHLTVTVNKTNINGIVVQIPQCIWHIYHNALFCDRVVHIFVTKGCIVGYLSMHIHMISRISL